MKRTHDDMRRAPLEDACDRAHKMRVPGDVRIKLEQIGFWNKNRGGMGLASQHLHEVAHSCCAQGVSLQRYQYVPVVEIPQEHLEEVREYNRRRCQTDPLMPKYSEDIKYVCAGKTHFLHALKLLKDGNRYLYNNQGPQSSLRLKPCDAEGMLTQTEGPLCAVFRADAFRDSDAMTALASEDNLNASVQMEEDEMQCFGKVSLLVDTRGHTVAQKNSSTVQDLLSSLRMQGFGKFSEDDYTNFINLRLSLSAPQAELFKTCQFSVCSGRVTVKPSDFGLAAKLDPRAPWCMISLLLGQYIGTMNANAINGIVQCCSTFAGRNQIIAIRMRKDVIVELTKESGFVQEVEHFIVTTLTTYSTPSGGTVGGEQRCQELLNCRANFLADVGRLLLRIGKELDEAEKKAIAKRQPLETKEKLTLIKDVKKGAFAKCEQCFRKQLMDSGVYSCAALPLVLHPEEEAKASAPVGVPTAIPLAGHAPNVKSEVDPPAPGTRPATGAWARRLYERLEVKGPGEEVMALPHSAGTVRLSHMTSTHADQGLIQADRAAQESSVNVALSQATHPDAVPSAAEESPVKLEEPVAPTEGEKGDVEQPEELDWVRCLLVDVEVKERMGADGRMEVDHATASVYIHVQDGTNRRMFVHPDHLRPCPKKITPEHVVVHPIYQAAGEALADYVHGECLDQHYIHAVQNVMFWAQSSVARGLADLRVTRQIEGGKEAKAKTGPVVLQVRAKRDFKKGTLMLVPTGGQVIADEGNAEKLYKTDALHASMITGVPGSAQLQSSSKELGTVSKRVLRVISPLLDKRTQKSELANLNPFRALLRCFQPTDHSNMALEEVIQSDTGIDWKSAKLPQLPRGTKVLTVVTVARNSEDIAEGQVLVLPWK